jgi:hypothetical protein
MNRNDLLKAIEMEENLTSDDQFVIWSPTAGHYISSNGLTRVEAEAKRFSEKEAVAEVNRLNEPAHSVGWAKVPVTQLLYPDTAQNGAASGYGEKTEYQIGDPVIFRYSTGDGYPSVMEGTVVSGLLQEKYAIKTNIEGLNDNGNLFKASVQDMRPADKPLQPISLLALELMHNQQLSKLKADATALANFVQRVLNSNAIEGAQILQSPEMKQLVKKYATLQPMVPAYPGKAVTFSTTVGTPFEQPIYSPTTCRISILQAYRKQDGTVTYDGQPIRELEGFYSQEQYEELLKTWHLNKPTTSNL